MDWQEVVAGRQAPARRRLGRVPALLILLFVAAGATAWLAARDASHPFVVIGEVLVAVTLLRLLSPRLDEVFGRFLARFGHVVGRVLSVVLLLAVFVVVLVPVWALSRLAGWNALEPVARWRGRWQAGERWWRSRPPRPFLIEPTRPAWSRVHAVAVVALVAIVGAGLLYEARIRDDPETAHRVDEDVVTPDAGVFTGYFSLAAYEGQPWARQYFLDLGSIPFAFDPYLLLRVPDEYQSAHVNVTDRVRWSYEQTAIETDDPIDVWFLGGSAAFGVGQRDEYTIASHLVRLAEADGIPVRIQNLGMSGYVTWQDNLLLATRLIERDPPDLVVGYNGSNDLSLYLPGGGARRISSLFADQVYGVLNAAGDRVFRPDLPDYMPRNTETDVDNAVTLYGQELELGRRVAAAWDLPIAQFFQPTIWTTEQRASIDPVLAAKGIPPEVYDDNHATWDSVRAALPDDAVIDLADSLDEATVPVYADTVHTNEEGARLVALAMYEHLRPQLAELAAGS